MKRFLCTICCVFLCGCPPTDDPERGADRQDCQSNCASCFVGQVRADCDDACLDLTEAAAKSFNRCAELSADCAGVPDCASTHLLIDASAVNNASNMTNNGTTSNTTNTSNGTNNRVCLGPCFDNTDCDSSARCEYPEGQQACCKRGTRGIVEIGQFCEDENDCVSGFCEAAKCAQYCEFNADCDPQFSCMGMRCIPGEMICDDFEDNDLNGATDCQDEACDGQPCDMSGGICDFASSSCM